MPPQRRESTMSLSVVLSMLALLLSAAALVVPLVTDQNDSTSCSCEFMTTSTDSDGVTTVEVPGDLVIRGGLVVSDDNSIERIRIDGGIGTERRRLTSGGTVSLRLNDENGNPRTEMDSDGNFRTRRADGTEVATVDATDGFKMKDSSSRVRFSTFEDGRTEISDEDGDVRTVSNKEGIELREKPTEGRRLAASGASSMPRGLTRLTAGTIEIRDENNKTRVKTDKEGQHVKNEQEEDVAVIDGDGVAVVARPGMTTKPAIRSIEEKPDGETVERVRVDTEKIEMRDEDNATRVRTTKEGETFLDDKERPVTIMGSEGVDVIEKAEENVVKFNLTVPADIDIETTKERVATMLMVAERDVDVKELPAGAGRRLTSAGDVERSVTVRPPADTSVETIKTELESKSEADVRVALGSDRVAFDVTTVKVETEATKPANATKPSIRAIEEKPDGTRKEVTKIDDKGVTVVSSNASATTKPSIRTVEEEDDGALLEVATMDVDGVKVAVRPGMTSKPAIRSIEEKPDGETVDRFRADNSGTEVRDENNMTRVKTDKDGAHVKDADGFDTAVIDGDGVTVMEKPGSTSRPAIRSVDETGVERFRADKDGTEIRDAQNGTRMRADQDGTSFFDSEGKSAVDITDGGILLNDRLATDGNTSESAIRMLSSNGTVRTKVDTGGYDLRNPDGYTSVKLSGAGAGNYTAALKIFDPVTGAPRFEAGADLGLRINDKNGTTRSRVHEGVHIYDANGTSSGQVAVALGSAGLLTYASDGDISLMMKRSGEIETLIAPQTVRRDELQTTAQAEIATHDAYDPEDELKEDGLYRRPGMKADTDEADVVLAGGAGDNKAPETYERADDGRTVPVVAAGMTAGGAKDCSTVDCQKPANHADACCRG